METSNKEGAQASSEFSQALATTRSFISHNTGRLAGCAALGLSVGMVGFGVALETSATETELSGHRVIIESTLDKRATLDLGLIEFRTDTIEASPVFGVNVTVKESLNGFAKSVEAGGEILGDPLVTLSRAEDIIKAQAVRSAAWGLGAGALAGVGGFYFLRSNRRTKIIAGASVVTAAALVGGFSATRTDKQVEPAPWIEAKSFILSQYRDDVLKNVPPELQGAQIRGISNGDRDKVVAFAEEKLIKPQEFVIK
ncbi:MAG: hypothetical protein WAS36_01175, partial [Candidatus Saccharimonadales bacterium]